MTAVEAVRAFVALEMPPQVREVIRGEQHRLRRELPRARWTRPEGQHVTLKFLGESSADDLAALGRRLTELCRGLRPVTVELGGAGFFPNPRRPRVAWIGGRADGGAAAAAAVDRAAVELGWPRERRPWKLHLTQARIARGWPEEAVTHFLSWGEALSIEPFCCTEVVLFASELRCGGAVYTALERYPLG